MLCEIAERDEQIVDYLYGELDAASRESFDAHLRSCAVCRAEVSGLDATRARIAAWAPPEQAEAGLGLRVVRDGEPASAPPPARWSLPGWGLAAAAALVLAASAAIANLEIRVGSEGLVVRTGWAQAGTVTAPLAPDAAVHVADTRTPDALQAELTRVLTRLDELEADLATRPSAAVPAASNAGRVTDEQVLQRVRQMIADSQGETLRRVSDVFIEFDRQRRTDLALMQQGFGQYQGATSAEIAQLRNQLVRVAFPEQQEK
jgi:hypothetical protein